MKTPNIPVESIDQRSNTRKTIQDHEIADLMLSLKQHGLLEPIGVQAVEDGRYECIYGNRRLLAAKKLGWYEIPCVIHAQKDALLFHLTENLQRKDISVAEAGAGFAELQKQGMTTSEIAAKLGIRERTINSALDVHRFVPAEYRNSVVFGTHGNVAKQGRVTSGTALIIAKRAKSMGLKPSDVKVVYEWSRKDTSSSGKVSKIMNLIASGVPAEEAIDRVDELVSLQMMFMFPASVVKRVEKLSGVKMQKFIRELVSSHPLVKMRAPKKTLNGREARQ